MLRISFPFSDRLRTNRGMKKYLERKMYQNPDIKVQIKQILNLLKLYRIFR